MDVPLIVYERSGRWAVVLRAAMAQQHAGDETPKLATVSETRSVGECLTALAETPAACVAVELTLSGAAATWELLARISQDFPGARSLILADRGLSAWERAARELGAVHLVDSPRRVSEVLAVARRHARRKASRMSWQWEEAHQNSAQRKVWWQQASLPWSNSDWSDGE